MICAIHLSCIEENQQTPFAMSATRHRALAENLTANERRRGIGGIPRHFTSAIYFISHYGASGAPRLFPTSSSSSSLQSTLSCPTTATNRISSHDVNRARLRVSAEALALSNVIYRKKKATRAAAWSTIHEQRLP